MYGTQFDMEYLDIGKELWKKFEKKNSVMWFPYKNILTTKSELL